MKSIWWLASGWMAALLVCGALLAPRAFSAELGILDGDEAEIADVVEVQAVGRDLVLFNAEGSGQLVFRLELKEELYWTGASGRVGIVLTNRRVLAATPTSASWLERRYELEETPLRTAHLGKRVAVVVTERRALGFFGGDGNWVENSLALHEHVLSIRVGESAAVVVTNRRALGISRNAGGFFPIALELHEVIEAVSTRANIASVRTSRRVMVFQGTTGAWQVRQRLLND